MYEHGNKNIKRMKKQYTIFLMIISCFISTGSSKTGPVKVYTQPDPNGDYRETTPPRQ